MRYLGLILLAALPLSSVDAQTETQVFSGPQPGERLPEFPARVLFEDAASTARDITSAEPTLIVVVHQLTRPSAAFARTLMDYAATRKDDGLQAALVFLGEDATELEQRVSRARHALPQHVQIALSPAGAEGPGSYGLNRNVTLTILLADDRTVVFNSAPVDPNIPTELPPVLEAICKLVGGTPPDVKDLAPRYNMRRAAARGAAERDAAARETDEAAEAR